MWVRFSSTVPFKIKMFAGGINVVSGEHIKETVISQAGHTSLQSATQSTQDYIVVPKQRWIDVVAVRPGVVRQFVAMPLVQGYTVEAQLTGEEVKGGLQLGITPSKSKLKFSGAVLGINQGFTAFSVELQRLDLSEPPQVGGDFYVIVRTFTGKNIIIPADLTDAINDLKLHIQDKEGIPPDQQSSILVGQRLHNSFTVADYQIPKVSLRCRVGTRCQTLCSEKVIVTPQITYCLRARPCTSSSVCVGAARSHYQCKRNMRWALRQVDSSSKTYERTLAIP